MNATATIYRTQQAGIELDRVLNIDGFNLDRALELDPLFLEPEYPFEWSGVYRLDVGAYRYVVPAGPDPAMQAVLLRLPVDEPAAVDDALMTAVLAFSEAKARGDEVLSGEALEIGVGANLNLEAAENIFTFDVAEPGAYALFTEHHPDEFGATMMRGDALLAPTQPRQYKPDHEHDEEVTSVGITHPGDLDLDRFNAWMREVLMTQGPDIFRTKGVLSFAGEDRRYVFQGVHMLLEGRPDRVWENGERGSKMIFIGRNLDRAALSQGFASCLV